MSEIACTECHGNGYFPWGPQDVICQTCGGDGRIVIEGLQENVDAKRETTAKPAVP